MFGAVLGLHQDVGGGSGGTDGYVVTGAGHSSHDTWMALTSGRPWKCWFSCCGSAKGSLGISTDFVRCWRNVVLQKLGCAESVVYFFPVSSTCFIFEHLQQQKIA
jgi:hypothetical protein